MKRERPREEYPEAELFEEVIKSYRISGINTLTEKSEIAQGNNSMLTIGPTWKGMLKRDNK